MTDTIMVAIISGLCVGIPSVLATWTSNSKHSALLDYKVEQMDKKVDSLAKKLESHNELEKEVATLKEQVKDLSERIKGMLEK